MLLAGALIVVVLLGRSDGSSADPAPPPHRPLRPASWIVSGQDLALLRRDNAGLARRFFDNGNTFVVGSPTGNQDLVPRGYLSIPTRSYTSLRAFEADVHLGRIDPRIAAVIYDPERWPKTPAAERLAPLSAMHRFTQLAAHWGYGPIVAPGRDLGLESKVGCSKREGELLDQTYLRCGLTDGAIGADDFVIQAAPVELEVGRLGALMGAAVARLRSRAPEAAALASISTDPAGSEKEVWPVDLLRAAKVELQYVPGIMFNFTSKHTDLAASFLRDLEREGAIHGIRVTRGN